MVGLCENANHRNDDIISNKSVVQPLVSAIIATYRRESALEKALQSLVNQTYEFIEIIVVDDNADDLWNQKVKTIIDSARLQMNMQIIYIKNKGNKGSAETRNIGIRAASGDYVTFLDDDDMYLPDKIKNQINHMIEKNSDYSITDLDLYDEKERLVERRTRKYISSFKKEDLLKYHLMYHMTGTDTLMFRREYLLRIGGFPAINVGDEFYLMQEAIETDGIFSYLPLCDVKAYVHTDTNGLSSGDSKIKGENELYDHKKKYFHMIPLRDKKYIQMRHYAVLAFAEIRRKNYICFIKYSMKSFFMSPSSCIRLFINRK